jgi:hypothetical protein
MQADVHFGSKERAWADRLQIVSAIGAFPNSLQVLFVSGIRCFAGQPVHGKKDRVASFPVQRDVAAPLCRCGSLMGLGRMIIEGDRALLCAKSLVRFAGLPPDFPARRRRAGSSGLVIC